MPFQSWKKSPARAQEDEPCDVDRPHGICVQLGIEGGSEWIRGDDVEAAVGHIRGKIAEGVENALHHWTNAVLRRLAARRAGRVSGSYEIEQMCSFGFVELQGTAMASSTSSETPLAFPRSSRV